MIRPTALTRAAGRGELRARVRHRGSDGRLRGVVGPSKSFFGPQHGARHCSALSPTTHRLFVPDACRPGRGSTSGNLFGRAWLRGLCVLWLVPVLGSLFVVNANAASVGARCETAALVVFTGAASTNNCTSGCPPISFGGNFLLWNEDDTKRVAIDAMPGCWRYTTIGCAKGPDDSIPEPGRFTQSGGTASSWWEWRSEKPNDSGTYSIRLYETQCTLDLEPDPPPCADDGSGTIEQCARPEKNLGPPCPPVGNPINPGIGNKYQAEADIRGFSESRLDFTRHYNSDPVVTSTTIGRHWRHTYDRSVVLNSLGTEAAVYRPDGKVEGFLRSGSSWLAAPNIVGRLEQVTDASGSITGWRYQGADDTVEDFDATGRLERLTYRGGRSLDLDYDVSDQLVTVMGDFGRSLSFTYDTDGRIASVTDPKGAVYRYAYDTAGSLARVVYADDTPLDDTDNPARTYVYEDAAFPHALTGIIDANGDRYATYEYDGQGRAVLTEHADGADRTEVLYNADETVTVTEASGATHVRGFQVNFGVVVPTTLSGDCTGCGALGRTYDTNGFLASNTDRNGNLTTYVNNARGLQTSRTEAVGTTNERSISTEWHSDFRLPVRLAEPGRETLYQYDAKGNLLTRSITDLATGETRSMTYEYDGFGQLLRIDGPREDVEDITRFAYDAHGNLLRSDNALGQVTQITAHDAAGRPLVLVDANGARTELTYDARGRLVSRSIAGTTTRFDYDAVGQLVRITSPNGSTVGFEYDAAHRLVGLHDGLGNHIVYTLDAAGNRVQEELFDPSGLLTRTSSAIYDELERLLRSIGASGQTTEYAYDGNGNTTAMTDPLGRLTNNAFDALDRITRSTDPAGGVTEYGYDARDNLTSVTDARGNTTRYEYNAFDEVLRLDSPDSGVTEYAYDTAGNRISQIDARGVVTEFEYDALDRLAAIRYPADPSSDVAFGYDEGANGIGRLTSMVDASGSNLYAYDARGNLVTETRTILGIDYVTSYAYDAADNLIAMTYPSERRIDYKRDAIGRVVRATTTLNGQTQVLAENVEYLPFGSARGWRYGNGIAASRDFDLDYRLTALAHGDALTRTHAFDPADNIISIDDLLNPGASQGFGYDALDRLSSAQGAYGQIDYDYDLLGNRLTKHEDTADEDYTIDPASNRLLSISGGRNQSYVYDAAGNTLEQGALHFTYDVANRMASASDGTFAAAYRYNGRGERVIKTVGGESTVFHFDRDGNMIAETRAEGSVIREYLYLDGQRLAMAAPAPAEETVDRHFEGTAGDWTEPLTLDVDLDAHTIALDGPEDFVGSYLIDEAAWNQGESQLSFAYRSEDGRKHLTGSLALQGKPLTGSLSLARVPRLASYRLDALEADGSYTGSARDGGNDSVAVQIDETARSVTVIEADRAPKTYVIPETRWRLWQRRRISLLWFSVRAEESSLMGVIYRRGQRAMGSLLIREGKAWRETYQLTGRSGSGTSPRGGLYYLHTDHLDTVQVVTDQNRQIVWKGLQKPFGETEAIIALVDNPLRFPGQYYDAETGLHYNYFRDYDPKIGRYVQSDPIGLASGLNTFRYADNVPVTKMDPTGLVIGTSLARLMARIVGRTSDEAAFSGKIIDVGIGTVAGDAPECIGGVDIGDASDLLRGIGGVQAVGLSTATTYGMFGAGATVGSATASVVVPVALAAYGGVEAGRSINSFYERHRRNSIGSDLYDLINEGKIFSNEPASRCTCKD
jgi:RHS repeat-associated protein